MEKKAVEQNENSSTAIIVIIPQFFYRLVVCLASGALSITIAIPKVYLVRVMNADPAFQPQVATNIQAKQMDMGSKSTCMLHPLSSLIITQQKS